VLNEGALHRMQVPRYCQALDGDDFTPLILDREGKARIDALAIHQHCACAAGALIAAFLGAWKAEMVTQSVQERLGAQSLVIVPLRLREEKYFGAQTGDFSLMHLNEFGRQQN
jgi:hypothetical protein